MSLRAFLSAQLLFWLGSADWAQDVRDLRLEHRSGQTFVTWREVTSSGTSYRVYRSSTRFTSESMLDSAHFLGEVDDESSRNAARSEVTSSEHGWVIASGAAELSPSDGLFVHTVAESSARSYYAVTSVRAGVEDRRLRNGGNTNQSAFEERAARPQPVLQTSDASGELWAHWVGDRDTPFLPALSLWPSQGFDFRFEPGSESGPRGLVLGLHAAGQNYAQGWPHRFELPRDVDLLTLHDQQSYTGFSFWYGAHERLPGAPTSDTLVSNYAQRRVLWTLDWMTARLGAAHDAERVYVVGGSMGAVGAMLLAGEAPGRFAAILCRNGLYDLEADDYRNPPLFERLYGSFALNLRTLQGPRILERFRARHMANLEPAVDWPVIRTISGRNDETVGWSSSVDLFAGLAEANRPAVHYFDERTHTPLGYWLTLERTLLGRTCKVRRDRPSLRFERCSLDDDPGDGRRTDGDPVGTINGYLEYDPETAAATASGLDFDVYLRDSGVLDDSPSATGWAGLTPRRTGPFALAAGERVRFTLRENGVLVDDHVLQADAHGLVHTPLVPLERTTRRARFERWSPGPSHLFLGASPIPGDLMQVVVSGAPDDPYVLFIGIGDSSGAPFALAGVDHVEMSGTLDASGFATKWLLVPPSLAPSKWLWARTFTADQLWPLVGVALQRWP
jgi:alpha/beta hydrolase family protein